MQKTAGYVLIIVLCVNFCLALLTVLLVQVVSFAKGIAEKHIQVCNDDCRFNFLVDLTRRYLVHVDPVKTFSGETIFDGDILIQDIDAFRGKINLFFDQKQYIAEIIIYFDGKEKKAKRIL
ncbi:hypothetical protein EKK58_04465 [Candidatus Dependentiae bacterium]|nr:MAG: hypothetical protein EKK58_04465 [Candidatus Dependentiae bacterium]